jgi:hypothetical protein
MLRHYGIETPEGTLCFSMRHAELNSVTVFDINAIRFLAAGQVGYILHKPAGRVWGFAPSGGERAPREAVVGRLWQCMRGCTVHLADCCRHGERAWRHKWWRWWRVNGVSYHLAGPEAAQSDYFMVI